MKYIVALIFSCVMLVSCGGNYPSAQPVLSGEQATYTLRENDVLILRVFDETELSGKYVLDSQGRIALPLVGKLQLRDMTEQQAAETIGNALKRGGFLRQPKVAVEVSKSRPFFIMGEVTKPGKFTFQSGITVYQAVAMAGGYTYRADRHDIAIRRQSGKGAGTEDRYSANEDTPVFPGDVIEVGERFF